MALLRFNGTFVRPDPSEMSFTTQDISTSDSGRSNQTGLMHKYVVAKKKTIHLAWNNPEQSEAEYILSLLTSGADPTYVNVTYDSDPLDPGLHQKTFYYGDISAALQQVWVTGSKRYSKLQFDLIER